MSLAANILMAICIVLAGVVVLAFFAEVVSLNVVGSRGECQAENPGNACRIRWEPIP